MNIPQLRCFNKRLSLACLLIAVSTFNYGFDNQAFATTQAMDAFDKEFGSFDEKTRSWVLQPSWLSLFNSLNYIGFAAGVVIGSLISSKFGRRWCMFSMSVYALGTATISITSMSKEQIMAARILNYVYVGMELAVVPAFQSEIVPAPARGLIVGTYQLSLILGGFVINAVCLGTSSLASNGAWRIPLGLFYIVPTIVLSLIFFVPESPRWLLKKGRTEQAHANLTALRQGKFTADEIDLEFRELQYALEREVEQGRFKEIFQGLSRKRTALVAVINFFQQATGQAFGSQYGTIYVKSLGTVNPFHFSLILATINAVAIMCSLLLVDKVGRKPMLLIGIAIQTVALIIMGGLGVPAVVGDSSKIGIVAMLALMSTGFSLGLAPLTYVVTTELPALRLRDHTLRFGFVINVAFNFAVNFSIPYLVYDQYAGLSSKVGFIFGAIGVLCLVFTHFCIPECAGKTLEQVDSLFYQRVPLRKFGSYQFPDPANAHAAAKTMSKEMRLEIESSDDMCVKPSVEQVERKEITV